jgi:hypothetical protein
MKTMPVSFEKKQSISSQLYLKGIKNDTVHIKDPSGKYLKLIRCFFAKIFTQ